MKRLAIALVISSFPAAAISGNYATCLLKNLPGLQNDSAAVAANTLCLNEFPDGMKSVEWGSGRGFFGYKSGAECAVKKAGETRSRLAGQWILVACRKLYDEPWTDIARPAGNRFDRFDSKPSAEQFLDSK